MVGHIPLEDGIGVRIPGRQLMFKTELWTNTTLSMINYLPQDPDNASIKASLQELKKLNSSTASSNKLIVGIALATLIVSIVGVIIALWK